MPHGARADTVVGAKGAETRGCKSEGSIVENAACLDTRFSKGPHERMMVMHLLEVEEERRQKKVIQAFKAKQ